MLQAGRIQRGEDLLAAGFGRVHRKGVCPALSVRRDPVPARLPQQVTLAEATCVDRQ